MSDPQTLGVYNSQKDDYLRLMWDYADSDPNLSRFLTAMPKGARVLDLGCGPGAYARHFAAAGLRVEAWDAAEEMLAHAAALPGVSARLARFEDLNAADRYDGIWAYFSLLHAPRTALPQHLNAIARALRPGGTLFLGMKLGKGGRRDSLGRHFEYYSQQELDSALHAAGLQPRAHWFKEAAGLEGPLYQSVVIKADG